jgi:hypothetical protein
MSDWATWTTPGILSGSGGVDTVEIGPVHGDLTVHTTWVDGQAELTVQYTGATDWFTIPGSPVPAATEQQARDIHQHMVEAAKVGRAATAPGQPREREAP